MTTFNRAGLEKPILYYLQDFPAPNVLLREMGQDVLSHLYLDDILKELKVDHTKLNCSAPELISHPHNIQDNLIIQPRPNPISFLQERIQHYAALLMAIMSNPLSKKNYEDNLPDQENVSERKHADQAAKLAAQLGLEDMMQLVLYFHDISRMTHPSIVYSHEHHEEEGDIILRPLGLFPYTAYHGYAKFLLSNYCPAYSLLISPLSKKSLAIQTNRFAVITRNLYEWDAEKLVAFLYKIMLLRVIDDLSKVPDEMVLSGPQIYLSEDEISSLVRARLQGYYEEIKSSRQNIQMNFFTKIHHAITLLSRPEMMSLV